jgi:hypothetical protein
MSAKRLVRGTAPKRKSDLMTKSTTVAWDLAYAAACTLILGVITACGSNSENGFGDASSPFSGDATVGNDGSSLNLTEDGSLSVGPTQCTGNGWNCKIVQCDGGAKTTVTAKVYDPAGKVPLYDVVVYVPNASVAPITTGPTCDNCATPVSGDPVASALTDATGQFFMQDVPVGINVPLVIQIGKWRRIISLPEVKACESNVFDDPSTFRLPANQSEGNLPKIALAVGGADSLECMLRRIGVSDSEFTNPSGAGRVNLITNDIYGTASVNTAASSYANGDVFPALSQLFASINALADGGFADAGVDPLGSYDVLIVSCQGSQEAGRAVTSADKQGLKTFVDSGGRAFLSHYNYSWLRGGLIVDGKDIDPSAEGSAIDLQTKYTQTPFLPIAVWEDPTALTYAPGGDGTYAVDTSFPKGSSMASWLFNVQASTTQGSIDLVNVKNPATSVIANVGQRWIYQASMGTPYISANTPLEEAVTPDQQCGRIVQTGIHVATAAGDTIGPPFPSGCVSADLTDQEKAMEFLFFDLSSCVTNDKVMQMPPATPK